MRKRLSALLLLLAMTLAACGTDRGAETRQPSPELTPPPTAEPTPSPSPTPAPTAAPEPTPTPEPVPSPTAEPSPTPGPVTTAAPGGRSDAYFDNALFIGDSIMEGIRQYVAKHRNVEPTLSNAQFLTSEMGVSIAELAQTGTGYRYQGTDQSLQQILAQIAPPRIFLLLGLNDLASENPDIDGIVSSYIQLLSQIREAVPGVEIIIMTNPPKVASTWLPSYTPNRNFNNALISDFVEALIQMCGSQGVPYVDIYQALQDGNGALPDSYCRDGFVHINDAGSKVAVDALYAFADGKG